MPDETDEPAASRAPAVTAAVVLALCLVVGAYFLGRAQGSPDATKPATAVPASTTTRVPTTKSRNEATPGIPYCFGESGFGDDTPLQNPSDWELKSGNIIDDACWSKR